MPAMAIFHVHLDNMVWRVPEGDKRAWPANSYYYEFAYDAGSALLIAVAKAERNHGGKILELEPRVFRANQAGNLLEGKLRRYTGQVQFEMFVQDEEQANTYTLAVSEQVTRDWEGMLDVRSAGVLREVF